jgi:hypothetical protein
VSLCYPPLQVQRRCFQQDGTRHFTLLQLGHLSEEQAQGIHFEAPPQLPVRLSIAGVLPLPGSGEFKNTIAIGVKPESGKQLRHILSGLRGVPDGMDVEVNVANLHMSLYRLRGMNFAQGKRQFEQVRQSLRKQNEFGSVKGISIAIKAIGGPYTEGPDMRVLASMASNAAGSVDDANAALSDDGYDELE